VLVGCINSAQAAAASYSWMSPPSRSCRRIVITELEGRPMSKES
jgi:hypothetical protein